MAPKPETTVYSNGRIVDGHRHIPNGHLITEGATIVAVGAGEPAARRVVRQRPPCRSGRPDFAARLHRLPRSSHHERGSGAPTPIVVANGSDGRALLQASANALATPARRSDDGARLWRASWDRFRAAAGGGGRPLRHAAFAAERPRDMHDGRSRLASDRPGGRRRRTSCDARHANRSRPVPTTSSSLPAAES